MSKDVIKDFTEIVEFYREKGGRDTFKVLKNTLDLINRQQAEIEKLERVTSYLEGVCESTPDKVRAEAIKEFADRLKEQAKANEWNGTICGLEIDRLEKEMVGEGK